MTNTEYAKAHYDLNKLKSMKAGDVQVTIFPDEVKKGSIIDNPINGKKFFVKKPPVEEEDGALCCTCVEIKNGKKLRTTWWQFPFVGLIVDGKPLKSLEELGF